MGFFYTMTAYKTAAIVMLIVGALIAFLCNRIAGAAVKEDEDKKAKVSWGLKIAGLALVVIAFFMILNA